MSDFDTAGIYLSRVQFEEEDIPDWAPRSNLWVDRQEEALLTRIEKRIRRVLTYGEACKIIVPLRDEVKAAKRFVERARKCPECGRWHTDPINLIGLRPDCIPF